MKNFLGPEVCSPQMFKGNEKNIIYLQHSEYSPLQKLAKFINTI